MKLLNSTSSRGAGQERIYLWYINANDTAQYKYPQSDSGRPPLIGPQAHGSHVRPGRRVTGMIEQIHNRLPTATVPGWMSGPVATAINFAFKWQLLTAAREIARTIRTVRDVRWNFAQRHAMSPSKEYYRSKKIVVNQSWLTKHYTVCQSWNVGDRVRRNRRHPRRVMLAPRQATSSGRDARRSGEIHSFSSNAGTNVFAGCFRNENGTTIRCANKSSREISSDNWFRKYSAHAFSSCHDNNQNNGNNGNNGNNKAV